MVGVEEEKEMTLPATEWCSPSNPQGRCKPIFIGGKEVCKPMTFASRDIFRALQVTVNALLRQDKKRTIREDARIGPQTLAAVNLYARSPFRDCNELSAVAAEVTAKLTKLTKLTKRDDERPKLAIKKAGLPFVIFLLLASAGVWLYYEETKKKPAKHKQVEGWF